MELLRRQFDGERRGLDENAGGAGGDGRGVNFGSGGSVEGGNGVSGDGTNVAEAIRARRFIGGGEVVAIVQADATGAGDTVEDMAEDGNEKRKKPEGIKHACGGGDESGRRGRWW